MRPRNRQVALLSLEGIPADEIADITGLEASDISERREAIEKRLLEAEAGDRADFEGLASLWQGQKPELIDVPIKTLELRAARSVSRIVLRDIREWAPALVLVPFFVWQAILAVMPLMLIANIELALTCVYVSYRLYRNGAARRPGDETVPTDAYLEAHRAAILGQADFVRRSRFWNLLPFAVGGVMFIVGVLLELASIGAPQQLLEIVALVWIGVMVFLWIVDWIHVRGVGKLRERAAQLRG